jgi:AcrR family transcriptional regulator
MDEKNSTKQKLLRAGIKLFSKYGYAATSTRMIATEAGVNLSAIAFHYNNKECLYAACLEYMHGKIDDYYRDSYEEIEALLEHGEMTKEKALEGLRRLIDLQIDAAFGQKYQTTLELVYQESSGPEGVYPLSEAVFDKQEGVMAKLLQVLSPLSDDHARIASRFINGSIIAFGEHKSLIKPYLQEQAETPEWIKEEVRQICLAIIDRFTDKES